MNRETLLRLICRETDRMKYCVRGARAAAERLMDESWQAERREAAPDADELDTFQRRCRRTLADLERNTELMRTYVNMPTEKE